MTGPPSDSPRPPNERITDSTRELGETATRENKRKDAVHPSRRALPDYPAR